MPRLPFSTALSWRERLVGDLTGRVLEIGVGKGENLPHYRRAEAVWGIEPHPERAQAAEKKARRAPVPARVVIAPAEHLPFPDCSFHTVVSSLVFCSVQDPRQALAEIQRVLEPTGQLIMVEHVRPATPGLARLFERITPWWSRIAHNCHLDRPTLEILNEGGWRVELFERRSVFVKLRAQPGELHSNP